MVYVASGELASLRAGAAAFGDDEAGLAAGAGGATVLRWELTEWSVEDAKLSAHVELDPWADYAMRCERDGGPAGGPGSAACVRGELSVDGETVQPFGAFVEPAEVSGGAPSFASSSSGPRTRTATRWRRARSTSESL